MWNNNSCVWSAQNMTWLHDYAMNFSNWEDGSLMSDLAAMDKCAALHTNTGKWEIVSCSDDLENGVICEAAQGEISFFFFSVFLLHWNLNLSLQKTGLRLVPHIVFSVFICFSDKEKAKRSKSTFELYFLMVSVLIPVVFGTNCDLSCIVNRLPQNLAQCSLPSSFSAWWLSWESQLLFGFCTRSTTLAPASSRHSSTTLLSESLTQTSRAWWRLRRLIAHHRRTFSLFLHKKHQTLPHGWLFFFCFVFFFPFNEKSTLKIVT